MLEMIPLFASLPAEEMQYLAEALRACEYSPGSVLFDEGEIGDRFTVILDGEVDVVKALGTPDERILATLGAGEFIGEMSLLYRDRLRSASARTRSPVRIVEMTHADFDALIRRQPVMAFRIMQEMSLRLRNSEDATIRDLQVKNQELAQAYLDLKAAQAQLIEKEKIEHELLMARQIQESILPKTLPNVPGWNLAAYWQPARAVSGDFYDFFLFDSGRLGIMIGDVTDKGVPAALVMATTRSVLRSIARLGHSPGQVLREVNEILCPEMPAKMFVTCQYLLIDPASGHVVFANAGHNLPYHRTDHEVVEVTARGMPLGLIPGMEYEEREITMEVGDSLLLYSDGLVEAHNPAGEMFGFPRLRANLATLAEGVCPEGKALMDHLLGQLKEFTGIGWEQEDDITFVTLLRSGVMG